MSKINPTNYLAIPPFPDKKKDPYLIRAVIETPRNIRHKYAFEQDFGIFMLKTTIPEGLSWPYDYGFVPCTLGDDGDPLDVLFLDDEATFTGCLVECRLIGSIKLEKNGEENDRLVACAKPVKGLNQPTDSFKDIADVPKEIMQSMCRFLIEYSSEQDNKIKFKGIASRKKALAAIANGHKRFKKRA